MHSSQAHSIPLGCSILMDFISEMLLAYLDDAIFTQIKEINNIKDNAYLIFKYRDDCWIFTNNVSCSKDILKIITKPLMNTGLRANTSKPYISNMIITSSVKKINIMILLIIYVKI